jgi:hypothetical protein
LSLVVILFFAAKAFADPNVEVAIQESKSFSVEYSSHLGEGDGSWDSASREVVQTVNCMTWLQWVIARSYAHDSREIDVYLDAVRYYDNTISFANRKHYVDRWILLEPEPLQKMETTSCQTDAKKDVLLELDKFRSNHGYSCNLYQEDVSNIMVEYLTPEKMQQCVNSLEDGYYVVFFIGNEKYMKRWGKHGMMGQVHSMILEKKDTAYIHHASVDYGKVVTEDWDDLANRLKNVSQGYTIYSLDPNWRPDPQKKPVTSGLLTCEHKLLHQ